MKILTKIALMPLCLLSIVAVSALTIATVHKAHADQQVGKTIDLDTDLNKFYLNPSAEFISTLVSEISADQLKVRKIGFTFIGLMSSAFIRYPDKAEEWLNSTTNRSTRLYMTRALWLAGRTDLARSAIQQDELPPRIVQIIERSSNSQAALKINAVTKVDIAIGMFAGSGNISHLNMITDFIFDSVDNRGIDAEDIYDFAAHYGVENARNTELQNKYKERGKPVIRRFVASAYGMAKLASLSSGHEKVSNWLWVTYPAPWAHPAARDISRLRFLYENQQSQFVTKLERLEIFSMLTNDANDLKRLFSNKDEINGVNRAFPKSTTNHMATIIKAKVPLAYEFNATFFAPNGSRKNSKVIKAKRTDNSGKPVVNASNLVAPAEFLDQQGEYIAVLNIKLENREVIKQEMRFLVY